MRSARFWLLPLGLVAASAIPVQAQQSRPGAAPPASEQEEPILKFEREYFVYPTTARRDPFEPLTGTSGLGPRFEDLALSGIIHSEEGQSVVLLTDGGGRIYRVRRGESVGNARVLSISPMRVLFAVENFGVVRQEVLELKRKDNEGGQP